MILRVGGALVLATLLALAAVTGAQAKPKPVKATKLGISMPAQTTAGDGVAIKLTALSKAGKPVRDFNSALKVQPSSSKTTLPAKVKLSKGRATLTGVEFREAVQNKVSFAGKLRGSARISVGAAALDRVELDAPATAIVGEQFGVAARGADAFGNSVAVSPSFSISPDGVCADGGCTPDRSGPHTVIAEAGGLRAERSVEVSRGVVDHITIDAPSSFQAGGQVRPTAVAFDSRGRRLAEQTGEITFSISPDGGCDVTGCGATKAGEKTITASVDGVSAERAITVTAGPAKTLSFNSGGGFELALPTPNGANADYSKYRNTPTSLTLSLTALDEYGNHVDTSGTQLSGSGLSCSGLTCSATSEGRPTLNAKLGDATTAQPVRVYGLTETYGMTCRGENYDLDAQLANGCEFAQPNPGHTTAANATSLGRRTSCKDGESQFSFSGTHARDFREHTGVEGFEEQYKGAPLFWTIQAGSGFCTNDIYLKFQGSSETSPCLSIKVRGADGRLIDSKVMPREGTVELQTGSGAYRDNEVLTFAVEASCWGSSSTNKTDFTVSGHL